MPITESIRNGARNGPGIVFTPIISLFRKLGFQLSFSLILIIILFGAAITQSIQQGSPIVFIEEFGGRIILADHTLEVKTREIIENPQQSTMEANLKIYDSSLPYWKKMYVYPAVALNNGWERTKSFFSKIAIIFTIITAIWFIYLLGYLIFLIASKYFIRNTSDPVGAIILTVVFLILIQSLFSALTYESDKPYSELNLGEKAKIIAPFRGLFFTMSHLPELFSFGKTQLVDSVKPFNVSDAVDAVDYNTNGVVM